MHKLRPLAACRLRISTAGAVTVVPTVVGRTSENAPARTFSLAGEYRFPGPFPGGAVIATITLSEQQDSGCNHTDRRKYPKVGTPRPAIKDSKIQSQRNIPLTPPAGSCTASLRCAESVNQPINPRNGGFVR